MHELSYELHTHNELALMLAGAKPLAMFYEDIALLPEEDFIPEEAFQSYVKSGRFIRAEEIFEGEYSERLKRNALIKYVLFAQPEEEWRINAMFLLIRELYITREWNETCERMQGYLLGYTKEQQDEWQNRCAQ